MFRFGLFGIPVTVKPWFWVVAILLSGEITKTQPDFAVILVWVIALFVSILWHELGHAVFQRRFGQRSEIELYGMGGLAIGSGRPLSRKESILVSLAGPGAGILLGIAFLAVVKLIGAPLPRLAGVFVVQMLWINLVWSLVNLLPVLPLDGGHVAQAALGDSRKAVQLGFVTALVVAMVFLLFGYLFGVILFGFLAYSNFDRLRGSPSQFGRFR